jgi:Ca2+-dependent lipid-binding protein
MAAPTFRVEIAEARDILAADSNGFSDPYVTMTLLDSRGGALAAGGSFKTKTQKKTLSPKWHESFVIGDRLDLRVATTLRLLLFDSDGFYSDDVLGVVDIPVSLFLGVTEPLDNWYKLMKHDKMKKDSRGELRLVIENLSGGAADATASAGGDGIASASAAAAAASSSAGFASAAGAAAPSNEPPNLLYVTLKSGKDLLGMDNNGETSDPLVLLSFSGQKHTSSKKERTLKPQWNEKVSSRSIQGLMKGEDHATD